MRLLLASGSNEFHTVIMKRGCSNCVTRQVWPWDSQLIDEINKFTILFITHNITKIWFWLSKSFLDFIIQHPEVNSCSHFLPILNRGVFSIISNIYRFFVKTFLGFFIYLLFLFFQVLGMNYFCKKAPSSKVADTPLPFSLLICSLNYQFITSHPKTFV